MIDGWYNDAFNVKWWSTERRQVASRFGVAGAWLVAHAPHVEGDR